MKHPKLCLKKIMEIPDSLIIKYFELATDEHPLQVQAIQERLRMGENPRDLKLHLAEIVTALYHGHAATMDAKSYFEAAFQKKVIPTNIPTLLLEIDKERIEDIIPQLISIHFIQSKSDFFKAH
ncbi:hypothetical protein OL548_27005 [Lysinibacillus sp. MHQ-1]|nr:hypothetical protein OL548_27005 [Lysinibacillus sp. MHQ-1]